MSDERIADLASRLLSGDALSPEDRRELLDALRSDEALRREFLEDVQVHGLLRGLAGSEAGVDAFVQGVLGSVRAGMDETSFVRKVELGIAGRDRRRRISGRPGPGLSWTIGLAAAGALVAALLFLHLLGSTAGTRRVPPEKAAPEAKGGPPEEIPAPAEKPPPKSAEKPREQAPPAVPGEAAPDAGRRARVEEEMRKAVKEAREKAPEAVEPAPKPAVDVPPATAAAVATVEDARGEVHVLSAGRRSEARNGTPLRSGEGLETAAEGSGAVLRCVDGTRIRLGSDTSIREAGRMFVVRGTVTAEVAKRPDGRPAVFETPHAEATILGTTFRLVVAGGDKGSTRLEVEEGRVRFKRLLDGKAVDVPGGHYAVAGAGMEFASRVRYPETAAGLQMARLGAVTVNFGPAGTALPEGVLNDSGEAYDEKRGFGWTQGRVAAGRSPDIADPLQATFVSGGSAEASAAWKMAVPNGRYLVTLSVGGPGSFAPDQGPHHVAVEGLQAVDALVTRNSRFHVRKDVLVTVSDRDLTVVIGGHRSGVKTADGTDDTVLNYMAVRRVP